MDFPTTIKAEASPTAPATTAATDRVPLSRYALFAGIALVGCAADLATKAWCFSSPQLRAGEVFWLWYGHVGIQLSRNPGALFGIGPGWSGLFAALSIIAAIAIPAWLFWLRAARDRWFTLALGCIMAGVLGNLYDRLGLSRELWVEPGRVSPQAVQFVRDWILWQVNDRWTWPNFNIADSMLVVGVASLMLHAYLYSPSPAAKKAN
jgi:signal peptidase II